MDHLLQKSGAEHRTHGFHGIGPGRDMGLHFLHHVAQKRVGTEQIFQIGWVGIFIPLLEDIGRAAFRIKNHTQNEKVIKNNFKSFCRAFFLENFGEEDAKIDFNSFAICHHGSVQGRVGIQNFSSVGCDEFSHDGNMFFNGVHMLRRVRFAHDHKVLRIDWTQRKVEFVTLNFQNTGAYSEKNELVTLNPSGQLRPYESSHFKFI